MAVQISKSMQQWCMYSPVIRWHLSPYPGLRTVQNIRYHSVSSHNMRSLSRYRKASSINWLRQMTTCPIRSDLLLIEWQQLGGISAGLRPSLRGYCEQARTESVDKKACVKIEPSELLQLAKDIRLRAAEIDKMILSLSPRSLQEPLKFLISRGVSVEECLSLGNDPLIVKNLSEFSNILSVFIQFGFPEMTVIEMFRKLPELHSLKEDSFISTFECLRSLGLTLDTLYVIIPLCPAIFREDLKNIQARFLKIREYFKQSSALRLLEKTPGLLLNNLEVTAAKIEYLLDQMVVSHGQILDSKAFSHSLRHIETRHTFVSRTGFFRVMKPKQGQLYTNPSLKSIMDTSDGEFAKLFGNMSLLDYLTFKELFREEKERTGNWVSGTATCILGLAWPPYEASDFIG